MRPWRATMRAMPTQALCGAIGVALLAALSLASPASAEDNPPIAYGGSVEPSSLDFNGGQVTITAGGPVAPFVASVANPSFSRGPGARAHGRPMAASSSTTSGRGAR